MGDTPPSKKVDGGESSPAVFSPSKRSYRDFVSVDDSTGVSKDSDVDEPLKKRAKATGVGEARAESRENGNASEDEDNGGESVGNGDDENNDEESGAEDGAEPLEDASSSAEDRRRNENEASEEDGSGRDDNNDDGSEEEEERICTDCGEYPCVFSEAVPTLVQFGIDRNWLPADFDFEVEQDRERAEARGRAMVQNPEDMEEIIQRQRHRRYETYRQFTAFRFGGGVPRTTHPNCVNRGVHRLHPAPHALYRGPLAERPRELPEERPEEEIFGDGNGRENEEVESESDESEYDIENINRRH
jgi:hypothetical protein